MARMARIAGGFALIAAGVLMLVLPGPGIVTIIAGLALLSRDLEWARRVSERVKRRFASLFRKDDPPV